MNSRTAWMTAAEAAGRLGVSRPTLYAYVSRGFVRSQSTPGPSRARGYSREDVERLRRRTEERRDPDKAAARALQWGVPVLESAITLIDGHTLFYRGHDAAALAQSRSVQEVASLVWTGGFDTVWPSGPLPVPPGTLGARDGLSFVPRAQSLLARASAQDTTALDGRSGKAASAGWRILQLLTAAATGDNASGRFSNRPYNDRERGAAADVAIDQALARAWGLTGHGIDVLRAALILCADHELNVSSFTARCVASAGSSPYAVVIAGLAALEGTRHGGASARVESMLASLRRPSMLASLRRPSMLASLRRARDLKAAVAARLRRGEAIDGFGHPLYSGGDPRAVMLIGRLRQWYGRSAELAYVLDFADAATAAMGERPNLDFALAALARVLKLPAGAPLTLFAIGRTIGWIGHAIEQYETGQLIRPRAKYVGVVPGA
jgi:citrate synthase